MKNIYLILALFLFNIVVAQISDKDLNNISLSVILPDNSDHLSSSTISKIESKIQHIVAKHGISGQGYSNDFVIYPKFEIYDSEVIEGMRNLHIVTAEFNLFIKQIRTGKVFSTYSKSIKGSGLSKQKAINQSISKISTSDKKLKEFMETAKRKILEYYINNCDQIAGDAESYISRKQYSRAISILASVPKEAKVCYGTIQQLTIKAYNAYQEQTCNENLMKAKAQIANNKYSYALSTLGLIDPSSNCSTEAKNLIMQTATKVEIKEQKEWNFMMKRYDDNMTMTKYRLNITKEIAKAYYKSKPQTVIYKSLF